MTKNDIIKLVVTSLVLLALIGIFTLISLFDVDLKIVKILSIKTLLNQHNEIEKSTDSLLVQEQSYKTALQTVEAAKKSYETEKAKYDAISDETIEMIKKATAQQKYDIEYIWVTLGNYAKVNNLSIILVEPGGTQPSTTGTTGATQGGTTQQSSSSSSSSAQSGTAGTTSGTGTAGTTGTTGTTPTSPSNVLSVEITGNYLNVADFIYEVENDEELRFKLDNISMQYVGNNNIKTTFNIKNLVVVK